MEILNELYDILEYKCFFFFKLAFIGRIDDSDFPETFSSRVIFPSSFFCSYIPSIIVYHLTGYVKWKLLT